MALWYHNKHYVIYLLRNVCCDPVTYLLRNVCCGTKVSSILLRATAMLFCVGIARDICYKLVIYLNFCVYCIS